MTQQEKRRRLSRWLSEWIFSSNGRERLGNDSRGTRPIVVEPLERRELLAADLFTWMVGSLHEPAASSDLYAAPLVGEGEMVAEGEAAPDLVAFAKALADSGTRFFGAAWCPFCTEQKELFEDGGKYLPFIEVTNPDRTPNSIAVSEGITQYPTWEFPDGTRLTGVQSLDTISQRSGVAIPTSATPSFDALSDVNVAIGSPLHIPIDAYDPNGDPLTVTVTSSDPSLVTAEVLTGNRSLRLNMQGFGDMVFELFEDRAPVPSGRVIQLAQSGFYDGVTFHRVINNFVIQGGDPTGTGAGGSSLGDFDDQFHLDLQHNRTGVLSFAKSTDDTNDSQFFITEGPQRFLDFNHSVFGQLVEGEAVREAISNTATDASDRPVHSVVIESAEVFQDTENRVIVLRPTGNGTGTATITVTVSDGEGNSTSQAFQATVVNDTANGAPFLNPVPAVEAFAGQATNIQLTAQDKEGDTLVYSVQPLGSQSFGLSVDSATGLVTITPPADFSGQLQFLASVRQTQPTTTTSPDDNQIITVNVVQGAPTAVDLDTASDSGTSDSDNITNANSLVFTVAGTIAGATVELRAGGTVVGTAVASGSTTQIVVSDATSLGEGVVEFTATQTINGTTSPESPALAVTLDRTAPGEPSSGTVPPTTIFGQQLTVDFGHAEEGQGLIYGLSGAPTGMAIDAATGQLTWTPTSTQVGSHSFTVTMTDVAGNTSTQNFSINVIDQPQVRVLLRAVDDSGAPLTSVTVGQTFRVQVTVEDLRPAVQANGVFAAYVDLLYDPDVLEPFGDNPISHVSPYTNDKSGSATTPGLIDELGAFSASTSPLGNDLRVLAEITFRAKAVGNTGLRLDAADDTGNDVLLFDVDEPISQTRVQLGALDLGVGADFQVADDLFNFDEDTGPHTLDVLANDVVQGTTTLTIVAVGTPSGGGQVSITNNGASLQYTPAANFSGQEVFTYTVANQDGVQDTATVTVQVADVNDPPVAQNDSFTVFKNSNENVLEVLANDSTGVDSPSAETIRVTAVGQGSAGGQVFVGSGGLTVRYTPQQGFEGTETFTYTLSDGRGGTATATVTVTVNEENPPPTVQNDAFTVEEDAAQASFDVLANDSTDDPGETLVVSAVGTSQRGSLFQVAPDGQGVIYRPAANFFGTEILPYTVRDSRGATASGLVTFTVTPVNDPPNAVDDQFTVIRGNASTTLDVLANDTNVDDGEEYTIIEVTQPPAGAGSIAIAEGGKSLIYTPPSDAFTGSFAITYTISDGSDGTDTATVNIEVRDFVPRKFRGTVRSGNGGNGLPVAGLKLTLTGTDFEGNAIERTVAVGADGSFQFDEMPPGNYVLSRPPLPFLHDAGESIPLVSAMDDGDLVADLQVAGTLKPQFFDVRDFLGSSAGSSLTAAIAADGTATWHVARGEWGAVSGLQVSVDAAANALVVTGSDANQNPVQKSVPISGGSSRVFEAGREANARLIKLIGRPTDVGLSAVATSAASAGSSASGAGGEGEAAPIVNAITNGQELVGEGEWVPPPVIQSVVVPSPETTSAPSVFQGTSALRSRLGSTWEDGDRGDSAGVLDPLSVDSVMPQVLPQLELSLNDELEQTLLSGALGSEDGSDSAAEDGETR
ncbi:MAG: peptidyl-prolyl cis-trans isomerase [Pirellulaceae bacterium]|nr:MAG: peptidyl-prolyl cis-trans isomerase [Pirellulaceae bacterium]